MKSLYKIEFEGTDGAGKTTGLKYFIEQAKKKGYTVAETREVGNPNVPACVKLREFVLDPNSNLSGEAMELIFSAMRIENEIWMKSLSSPGNPEGPQKQDPPNLIVSDRGWFSHLAYTDHNVNTEFTKSLYKGVIQSITSMPDLTVYFKVSTDIALKRRVKRGAGVDVIEMKGVEFQEKVRASFEKHLEEFHWSGKALTVINADEDLDNVKYQLDNLVENLEFLMS